MKKYISIGIGGAAGALLRCGISRIPFPFNSAYSPLLTMLINISGSFFLGFFVTLFAKEFLVKPEIQFAITTGLLGGYTTFSTLCKESVMLCFSNYTLFAAIYFFASVLFGLTFAWIGIVSANHIERTHI